MRMARVNVYLPDELAQQARDAGLNVSSLTQRALKGALLRSHTDRWLDELDSLASTDVPHESVVDALDRARDEFGG
jgi:post-segregation antitoxin (ccd killing protein)